MSDWALEYRERTSDWSEVTVSELMERGNAVARTGTYRCPHPDCRVTVFLQLPDAAPGKRPISPYFQAKRPAQHGAHVPGLRPSSERVHAPLTADAARAVDPTRFPTAWRDPRPRKKDADGGTEAGGPQRLSSSAEGGRRGSSKGGHGKSKLTVSSVRSLVHHWLTGQPDIRQVVFSFRSASMVLEEFFVDLRTVQPPGGVRVFHAPIATVQIWGSKSVSLVLDVPGRDVEAVCHVPFGPPERNMHPTLFQRMGAVSRGAEGEAYMMGTASFSGRTMKVLPLSSGHVWIELTGE
jgi:hypothetical protein